MPFDKRLNERYEHPDCKVEYTLEHLSGSELFEADLINANRAGLCMLSRHRFAAGQEITIRDFMACSSRTAVVIWAEEYDEAPFSGKSGQALFKVGLQFSE
jgi:hypothetical protein